MNIYIYAKVRTPEGIEMETILNAYYKLPESHRKKYGKKGVLDAVKRQIDPVTLGDLAKKDSALAIGSSFTVVNAELVTKNSTKWIDGEYYAHEYDARLDGRARKHRYSNGYYRFQVQCLDEDKVVMDGIWSKEDEGAGQISNGSGDTFEPHERGLV